jgi:hypothetical protein
MTSQKQLEANRRNAFKSTGPKSAEGKASVRHNAVRHGAMAETVVIPFIENREDWEAHEQGVAESLRPLGYMETLLVERIASLMWRLRRANRFERELIALEQEAIEPNILKEDPSIKLGTDELRMRLESAQKIYSSIESFLEMKDSTRMKGTEAAEILIFIGENNGRWDLKTASFRGIPQGIELEDFSKWTAGLLRQCIADVADHRKETSEQIIGSAVRQAENNKTAIENKLKQLESKVEGIRRLNLLPEFSELEKITRYEAHLERSLYKAMHELERMQATRAGQAVQLPVVIEVDVPH